MNKTQKWLVVAGTLIWVATNAVALIGVASNRIGPPESTLALTEREFTAYGSWRSESKENNGLSLDIRFRTETARSVDPDQTGANPWTHGGLDSPVRWLDQEKLVGLGFNADATANGPESERYYNHMLERSVLLVLELDGPASQLALQEAHDRVAYLEREAQDGSQNNKVSQSLKQAQVSLEREENESRLFIIDAGLDEKLLRQQYPDRTHYAIVRGNVRPTMVWTKKSSKLYGMVTAVHCQTIHVPLQFRPAFATANLALSRIPTWQGPPKKPLTVQVAFGRRLEPWILAARFGGS